MRIGRDGAEVIDRDDLDILLVSCAARRTSRPMRPKPLIATRIAIVCPFDSMFPLRLNASDRQRLDLGQAIMVDGGDGHLTKLKGAGSADNLLSENV